jgi:hypothetical protein
MADLVQPIIDVMTRIRSELPEFKTVRIWNNQTKYNADGQYPDYAKRYRVAYRLRTWVSYSISYMNTMTPRTEHLNRICRCLFYEAL